MTKGMLSIAMDFDAKPNLWWVGDCQAGMSPSINVYSEDTDFESYSIPLYQFLKDSIQEESMHDCDLGQLEEYDIKAIRDIANLIGAFADRLETARDKPPTESKTDE